MNEDDHQFEKCKEDDFCKLIPSEETIVEKVWCMKILTCVMMSRFFCFLNRVSTHDMMIWHANGYTW